jgi:hypothetical protein
MSDLNNKRGRNVRGLIFLTGTKWLGRNILDSKEILPAGNHGAALFKSSGTF